MGSKPDLSSASTYLLSGVGRIPLKARSGAVRAWTTVDLQDMQSLGRHRWYLHCGYANRHVRGDDGKQRSLRMHRAVMGLDFGNPLEVDHISRNRLDNRRGNLRVVTRAQNNQNVAAAGQRGASSKFRGVSWFAAHGKWVAQGRLNGRGVFIGYFEDEAAAALAAREWRERNLPYAMN